ncbi:iron complex outermembrane recepter protein [bacterium A37T11]|nr:iron complex outermembrane recepter protein [bacterium A37T11]
MEKFNKIKKIGLLSLMVWLLTSHLGYAQTISVTGVVSDENGPLAGATVRADPSGSTVPTDASGKFKLSLAAGKYRITASYTGYDGQTQTVTVSDGADQQISFTLSSTSLSEVVVVGSRAEPRSRLDSPAPVDIINIKNITKDVGQVTLNQILNYVAPSFNANTQVLGDATDHIDPASLRGLGPDQVLVLINGKRRHTTSVININGTFGKGSVGTDLNAIPTAAIKKIEILRDGAAAQYGSDAIAGVINIILDDAVNKLTASATYGGYASKNAEDHYDGQGLQANVNYGVPFGHHGGFINVAGSFDRRDPTNRQKEFTGTIFNDYNNPELYPNPTGADITDEELKRRGLTRADFVSRIGQSANQGGSLFFNGVLPVDKNGAEVYAFGGLNYRNGQSAAFRRQPAQLTQTNASLYPLGYLPIIATDNYDHSLAIGVRGNVGGWHADLSNTYGGNNIDFRTENTLNASQLDATKTRFEDGGYRFLQNTTNLDFNRYFENALSGINVAFGFEHRYEKYQILQGEEASYADYGKARKIGVDADGNDITIPDINGNIQTLFAANGKAYAGGAQSFPGFRPENAVNATRSEVAAYTDLEFNFTPSWLVTGALRFENYNDFGSTLNWKVSTRYKIDEVFALRGAASTGFRAPSLQQRFFSATSSIFVDGEIINSGTFTNDSRPAKLLGIPDLKEEKSKSYSVGLTANYGKFKATVDGYFIRIDDRIVYTGQFTGSNAADASAQDKEIYTLLNQANASSARFFANAINTETKGIDVVLSYADLWGVGHFKADLSGTFVKTILVGGVHASPTLAGKEAIYLDQASRTYLESAVPRVKANLSLNYSINRWGFFLRNVYFGPVDAATNVVADEQTFGGKVITDLSVNYGITKNLSLTLGANNLLDIYPDETIGGNRGAGYFIYSRTSQQFGTNGRYLFTRLALTL